MIVYGKNVWNQIQNQPDQIQEIYVQQGLKDRSIEKKIQRQFPDYKIKTRKEMDAIAQTTSHQGIVCKVKEIPTYSLEQLVSRAQNQLFVVLDGIQDPHNVGAILRSCDCTGVDGLILSKHRSAGLTPAAVKSSTGAAYTVPVSIVANVSNALKFFKEKGYWIIGTDMENARDYRQGIYDVPVVLVIGSEGKGISTLVKKQCDYMISIPMQGSISSLNASVACAVVLYQIYNQRNPL